MFGQVFGQCRKASERTASVRARPEVCKRTCKVFNALCEVIQHCTTHHELTVVAWRLVNVFICRMKALINRPLQSARKLFRMHARALFKDIGVVQVIGQRLRSARVRMLIVARVGIGEDERACHLCTGLQVDAWQQQRGNFGGRQWFADPDCFWMSLLQSVHNFNVTDFLTFRYMSDSTQIL